jgi:tRNA-2-methylthio-N6-dimethylallyladenosine synthase
MGRRYSREEYLAVVERLRAAIPGLGLTTDLIVGFPGETDADFDATESLVREVGFDDAYTFRYSPREGTGALRLPGAVDDAVAGTRLERLIATVRDVARRRNAGLVGTTQEVLVEKVARRGGLLQSRTRSNKVVLVAGPTDWIGTYLQVRLTGTTGSTFTGVPDASGRELAIVG